ncbi:MAG: sulfatase-like hydrolase/transferase [Opitutaceae bacterium]|nr:sulfatase-like hydrolase/transferase [Opitutaceae bacterium]
MNPQNFFRGRLCFPRWRAALWLLLPCSLLSAAGVAASAGSRPNIVLLLADDLGYGDLGVYGNRDVPTPNLDRLAREGTRFTDAYVTCPACAPSRLSLMSGAYPQRFGMTWNDDRSAHKLPDTQRLLPELLRDGGYVTGLIGKWNIIRPAETVFDEIHDFIEWESDYWPQADGRYIGSNATKNPGFRSSKTQYWGPVRQGDEYLSDRLARKAVEFIDRHADESFFLFVGFNAVHSPWQGRTQDRERFAHLPNEVLRLYASMIAGLDEGVGHIMEGLRKRGLEENTLVLFLGDNGPAIGGPRIEGWKPDWPQQIVVGSTGALRGAKTELLEGGIREPFLMRWPARLAGGREYRRPVIANDVLPTLCAAGGVDVPSGTVVDGVDLLPYLRAQKEGEPHATLYWKVKSSAALRRGDWKLMMLSPEWKPQLYHLGKDISELHDVAGKHPQLVRELHDAWLTWNAPLPPPARH